ncbi:MAG: Isochorismatase family protein [Planctomycetes bacterium ADurb.Bin126]|nr:MAG: Isochorismatase family protein [Planctomycetes bacterium ADurb.Bin126]HOD80673.1 isochorismatase family protein [Phycisphaerae bacterium]HQL73881.1 isochorismatase family protein [Phycisphaerae bacterium]
MKYETILLDIETQRDFFDRDGSCYTSRAEEPARNIARLFQWAKLANIPVVSTVLRVRLHDIGPLAQKPHCIEGTRGEEKLPQTLLPLRVNMGLRNTTDLPPHLLRKYGQVIFEKRFTDIFTHERIERLITELDPCTFVICGAGLAKGIAQAAIGLRTRGFGVVLARDAALDLDDEGTAMAERRMDAKGVVFAPTEEIVIPTPAKARTPFRTSAVAQAERE